ncbi:diphosphomevalonate decarboxylase [Hydrogenovibrio kuenenii]|uniref:diphosphomevalonate decarboxylase n=1 Tax=Hydrogenovibrio kuenenii TaxID=63658 RepID=UPI0004669814|nr:diphosphomevalonate decarboxylase [Hydrogenovibrio kuenenii]
MTKTQEFINAIIPHKIAKKTGTGLADVNIALSKYWGKRDSELNLPTNSSLSISLPGLGTRTQVSVHNNADITSDQIWLNNQKLDADNPFATRLSKFLDLFRATPSTYFEINTKNTVPTAAGLASSASGYAALVLALNDCFDWQLTKKDLSLLARLGSGSASRSVYDGFVIWHKGNAENGLDSFAETINTCWPEFCVGLLEIDLKAKKIGSTAGMQQTVNHCALYQAWPEKAEEDVKAIQQAIVQKDFSQLGALAENNALSMHATMIATWPPILYWQPESVEAMQTVWALRESGIDVYFTMDAGPNLKLLFLEKDADAIQQAFPKLKLIRPFH